MKAHQQILDIIKDPLQSNTAVSATFSGHVQANRSCLAIAVDKDAVATRALHLFDDHVEPHANLEWKPPWIALFWLALGYPIKLWTWDISSGH